MNIDYSELERGFSEEIQKHADYTGQTGAPIDTTQNTQPDKWRGLKSLKDNFFSVPEGLKPVVNAAKWVGHKGKQGVSVAGDVSDAAGVVGDVYSGSRALVKALPSIVDNVGKFAPLAIGAMMLPSLMGKGQQGGAGQPVVVNNYMGQKPNILTPRQGVHSLSEPMPKMSEFQEKKADIITKALADAAKRRMANKVLDVVTPEEDVEERRSPEELEVVTKYPEMAKMLEDEQNKAYLNRLLQH